MAAIDPMRQRSWRDNSFAISSSASVLCVGTALVLSLAFQYYQFRDVESPLFALSIAVVTWYAGNGPLNVTGEGNDVSEGRAYAAVEKIDRPDGFYRQDIGWRALLRG